MPEFKYAQCLIKREEGGSETAWIPLKFARKHQKVILEDKQTGIRGEIVEVCNKIERIWKNTPKIGKN